MRAAIIPLIVSLAAAQDIRINAGGPTVTDSKGTTWVADAQFNGGVPFSGDPVVPEPLRSVRYGNNFSYVFQTLPGEYTVNLTFREQWANGPGQRIFSVQVNGQPLVNDLDLFQEGGTSGPVVKTTKITSAGNVTIAFTTKVRNAMVSSIELTYQPPPTARPSNMRVEKWRVTATTTKTFAPKYVPATNTIVLIWRNGIIQALESDYQRVDLNTPEGIIPQFTWINPSLPVVTDDILMVYFTEKGEVGEEWR